MIVDPESSAIYHMIAVLREEGIDKNSRVFQAMLQLFTEIRTLERLAEEAQHRSDYWFRRCIAAEQALQATRSLATAQTV